MKPPPSPTPSTFALVAGLLTLYLVWGSTYLAIRVAVESLPPFLMSGSRFLVAGGILALFLALRRGIRITRSQLLAHSLIGALMLVGGNGLVCWAEKEVPSGIATLIVSMSPVAFVLLDWMIHRWTIGRIGHRPAWTTLVGITMGCAGLMLLIWPDLSASGPQALPWLRLVALGAACLFWSLGSLMTRYHPEPLDPMTASAIQMLWGGIWLLCCSWGLGEMATFQPSDATTLSLLAWGYLILAGSLVAFTTYVWLMNHYSPTIVSTYGYVNPLVAVFLGWWLLNEQVDWRIFVASAIIVAGVATISLSAKRK